MLYKEINNFRCRWIVLIHCVCGTEKIFKHQIETLSKYYNLIIIRLPGHEIKSQYFEANIDYVADEIYKIVRKKNIIVDVMGVSLGSMIASKFSVKYSEVVGKVYLIGAIYGFSYPFFKFGYNLLMKVKYLIPRKLYMFCITYFILPNKRDKEQRHKLYTNSQKMNKNFLYLWMEEMARFMERGVENLNALLNTNRNVSFIFGDRDKLFLDFVNKHIDRELFGDNVILLKGTGHLCNISDYIQFNNLIEEEFNEKITSD